MSTTSQPAPASIDLSAIRQRILAKGTRQLARPEADFYTLADWAILRTVMGEDLRRLPETERQAWIGRMAGLQQPADGSFPCFDHHSALHANGTAVGAFGALGGRFRHPVRLYTPFATPDRLTARLDQAVDWSRLWTASHLFWGGVHCFALAPAADAAWQAAAFAWLDREADPVTGWWRRGVSHHDRHQPLGGAVHILPIYQHLGRRYPYIELMVDSTLALQRPEGHWLDGNTAGTTYLDLDALYICALGQRWAPAHRPDAVAAAVRRNADLVLRRLDEVLAASLGDRCHVHWLLSLVGVLGLHRQLDPERFRDDRPWSDIFSDPALYQTAAVDPG
jgi:hypothetical protein